MWQNSQKCPKTGTHFSCKNVQKMPPNSDFLGGRGTWRGVRGRYLNRYVD